GTRAQRRDAVLPVFLHDRLSSAACDRLSEYILGPVVHELFVDVADQAASQLRTHGQRYGFAVLALPAGAFGFGSSALPAGFGRAGLAARLRAGFGSATASAGTVGAAASRAARVFRLGVLCTGAPSIFAARASIKAIASSSVIVSGVLSFGSVALTPLWLT